MYLYRTDSIQNDTYWYQFQKLQPNTQGGDDEFGFRTVFSRHHLVVSAFNQGVAAGEVYVYYKNASDFWELQQKILPEEGEVENSGVGMSIDVDDSRLIIGAWGNGSRYADIYELKAGRWERSARIEDKQTENLDSQFGGSVAIYNDTVLIGAKERNHDGIRSAGVVYVYQFDENNQKWEAKYQLIASDARTHDRFGRSVAITGDVMIVTSEENEGNNKFKGAVYLFKIPSPESVHLTSSAHKKARCDCMLLFVVIAYISYICLFL